MLFLETQFNKGKNLDTQDPLFILIYWSKLKQRSVVDGCENRQHLKKKLKKTQNIENNGSNSDLSLEPSDLVWSHVGVNLWVLRTTDQITINAKSKSVT